MRERYPVPKRDEEGERRERQRYELLEKLYLLTGGDCDVLVGLSDLDQELGISLSGTGSLADELEQLGYLRATEGGERVCVTPEGVAYLRQGAWRRRSIRG